VISNIFLSSNRIETNIVRYNCSIKDFLTKLTARLTAYQNIWKLLKNSSERLWRIFVRNNFFNNNKKLNNKKVFFFNILESLNILYIIDSNRNARSKYFFKLYFWYGIITKNSLLKTFILSKTSLIFIIYLLTKFLKLLISACMLVHKKVATYL